MTLKNKKASFVHYECSSCNGVFDVRHDMDEVYRILFCPFCSEELLEEDDSSVLEDQSDEAESMTDDDYYGPF